MSFLLWFRTLPGAVAQGMIWGIMAIGVYITFKILDVADLTVDSSIVTGSAVFTVLVVGGCNIALAMLLSFIVGLAAGLVTGLFHTFLGIPAILAGILTQLMLYSVNLKIQGKANIALPSRSFKLLISPLNKPMAILVLSIFIVVLIGALYWFFGTQYGLSLRATGNNLRMSRAQGINTSFNKVFGLALSNGIVALSGALLAQYQGASDINMGRGGIVIGLASVVIGEAIVSRISSNFIVRLLGVVLGSIVYFFVYQTVIFLGLDTDLLKMLSALVVAVFLGFPYLKKTYLPKLKLGGKKNA